MQLFDDLINDLVSINFDGRVAFSGFVSLYYPKNLDEYISKLKNKLKKLTIEVVSNGDPLLAKNGKIRLKKLFDSGLDTIKISMYDGPHQIKIFNDIKEELKLSDEKYIIRKRYLGPEQSYGITISNRAGSVNLKNEKFELKPLSEPLKQPCYYPFYKVLIDHNGDVLMCSNDWKKEKSMGNLSKNSLLEIWSNTKFVELRKKLMNSDRRDKPCSVCDVNGLLNGKQAFDRWKISSKINKNIKIGIVGSGNISQEYIKVIKFFNHKVIKIVTKTKSRKNIIFCKKNNIKYHYLNFNKAINSSPKVDAWIVCSPWDTLKKNLSIAIKNDISLLIEKSIIITSKDLVKLKSKLKSNQLNRISIAYNRNYYDFIPYLIKEIKKGGLVSIYAYLPESFQSIIKKKGMKIKNHLIKYMTSHWITLIYNAKKY